MDGQELREALRGERIRDDAYDQDRGHLPDTYTLSEAHCQWFVYDSRNKGCSFMVGMAS
jgi:hypothetical protein